MENTIEKRIASLRKGKGLTQDELSEMMGISPQAISKWENDQSYPDITSLPQLAEILGITQEECAALTTENAKRFFEIK